MSRYWRTLLGVLAAAGASAPVVPAGGLKTLTINDTTAIDPVITSAGPNIGSPVGASGSGWVATVVLKGLTSLVGACDPTALSISVSDPGFDASGNATAVNRTITGVAQIRRQYPNGNTKVISTDGTDLTLLVSLDDWIYTGTTIVSATIGASFYTGCTAGNTGATISNLSTIGYTKPVFAWLNTQHIYNPAATFAVEAITFHRNARQGRQVAAMKLTATDGTNVSPTITVAATTLSTIQTQGNIAEVYAATMNTAGLTQGICWVTAKVYPWLGDASAVLDLAVDGVAWPTSLPYTQLRFYSDPAATYGGGIAYVQVGASGGTVSSTAATARAAPFPTVQAAFNALATWNNTASGGHSVLHLDHGGGSVRFMDAAGSPVTHTISGGPTLRTALTWCEITKDPLAVAAVTLQWSALAPFPTFTKWAGGLVIDTGGAGTWCCMGPNVSGSFMWLSGLTFNSSGGKSIAGYASTVYQDNCTYSVGTATMLQLAPTPVNIAKILGAVSLTQTAKPGLSDSPKVMVGCVMSGFSYTNDPQASGEGNHGGVVYNNRLVAMAFVKTTAVNTLNLGFANVQNLYESDGSAGNVAMNFCADGDLTTVMNYVDQHNTGVGNRCSRMYNDVVGAKVTPNGIVKLGSHRYSVLDDYNIKTDTFTAGQGSTGNWAETYSVGNTGNVSLFGAVQRVATDAPHNDNADTAAYMGNAWLPSSNPNLQLVGGANLSQAQIMALFTNYTVAPRGVPVAGGTYTPLSTAAVLKNRVPAGFSVLAKDISGAARRSDGTGAAGAYESL